MENLEKRQKIHTKTTSENNLNSDSRDDNVNSVNSSSSSDDEQFSKIKGKRYSKLAFYKLYNGPKKYLPGQEFQYEFSGPVIDPESQAVLRKILKNKKTIKSKMDKLSSKKNVTFRFTQKPSYPCIFRECLFQGNKAARHLEIGAHQMPSEKSKLVESFARYMVNHNSLVVRKGTPKPSMCHICKFFYQRFDTHYVNYHQMIRQKPDYNRVLKKSSNITKMFLKEFSDLKSNNDNSVLNTSDPTYSLHVSSWKVGKKDNKK